MADLSWTARVGADLDPAALWDDYRPTGLIELPRLADLAKVGRVFVKLEGERPLGNFKSLGGMAAGLRALARDTGMRTLGELKDYRNRGTPLQRLVCASDGNHGLAVAAAAASVGAVATVYLPLGVSRARARRIEDFGGDIVRIDGTYDHAVLEAASAAAREGGLLIPDTTVSLSDPVVEDVMSGYAVLARELVSQFRDDVKDRPTHMCIQAGVGGLAAAMASGLDGLMQQPEMLLVVEPESAACVARALAAGRPVRLSGDLQTCASMLSCGLASAPALRILQRHGARAVVVGEDQLQRSMLVLRDAGGPDSTPSGAAGLAGLLHVASNPRLRAEHFLGSESKVLLVATEGAVAGE